MLQDLLAENNILIVECGYSIVNNICKENEKPWLIRRLGCSGGAL